MKRNATKVMLIAMLCVASVGVAVGAEAKPSPEQAAQQKFQPLIYSNRVWYESTFWTGPDWTRVGRNWHHPGLLTPSIRRFDAPRDGEVTVSGRVYKLHLQGNGIRAEIRLNDRSLWNAEIDGPDEKGKTHELKLRVKQGDSLRFLVDSRGQISCDTTGWDPAVSYTGGETFQASTAFDVHKQGAGGWYYEMFPVDPANWQPRKVVPARPDSLPEPPTEQLPLEVARQQIERDWVGQRGSQPAGEAAADELTRMQRILDRQAETLGKVVASNWRQQIETLRQQLANASVEESAEMYLRIRRAKRSLLLADPQIDFDGILCIDNPYVHGSEDVHEIRHRNEDTATPGGRLLVLEGLGPGAPVRKLAPRGTPAAFWRPDLSFDAKRVLFCMKSADEPAYHIYEVGIDGENFRQVTQGRYNDLDPIYTPDDNMVFSTSRCNQYLRCGGSKFRMFVLARSDLQGRNIYFISANNEADYTPAMLPDGRILYTRWEYVDKEVIRIQSLWTVNPDGTGVSAFWGNQSRWPDMLINARLIPGTQKVLFSSVGHHDAYAGPIGVVEPNEGINYPDGVYNLTPHLDWAEVGAGPADQDYNADFQAPTCYMAFQTPYPLGKDLLLVSARRGKHRRTAADPELGWFNLYLMDYDGNMELLYEGSYNILHAQPIRSRPRPRVIPSSVQWPGEMVSADQRPADGYCYSSDIYEGTSIPRGIVKSLRVLEVESQTYCDGIRSTGKEANLYRQAGAFPSYNLSGETVTSFLYDEATKRILGTVPVREDGSVYFKVPPMRALYFQLLDERGRCLQTMRSFTHVMPGETRGCVGCHETRSTAPPRTPPLYSLAQPSEIKPPAWGDETISFPRFVQPILNKRCISCHGQEKTEAEIDLTHRTEEGTLLSWSYVTLVFGKNPRSIADLPRTSIAGPIFPYHTYPNPEVLHPTQDTVVPPMTAMSYRSKLIELATSGKHYDVKVTPEEEARLVAWVDALCPFLGLEELVGLDDLPAEKYYEQAVYRGMSYPARMRTAPAIHRAFRQDRFESQRDRIPCDEQGRPLPSVAVVNGKRVYRIPQPAAPNESVGERDD